MKSSHELVPEGADAVSAAQEASAETSAPWAVEARGLRKRYDDVVAVDGIELQVSPGTCLGLLGPNGAGKTTTIEMLEGLKEPDEGSVSILGMDWRHSATAIRQAIGVQLQETTFQDKLTVFEVLRLFRSFYSKGLDLEHVLRQVGLVEKRGAMVSKLSGGQKQRLALGCALLSDPRVLFLDEPTTGLDPQARRRVWEIVEEFKSAGGTVVLTTHYMEEAERLADDLAIVDRGQVIARGSPEAIIASLEAESLVDFVPERSDGDPEFDLEDFDLEAMENLGRGPRCGAARACDSPFREPRADGDYGALCVDRAARYSTARSADPSTDARGRFREPDRQELAR